MAETKPLAKELKGKDKAITDWDRNDFTQLISLSLIPFYEKVG